MSGLFVLGLEPTANACTWASIRLDGPREVLVRCGVIRVRLANGDDAAMREMAALVDIIAAREAYQLLVRVRQAAETKADKRSLGITDALSARVGRVIDVPAGSAPPVVGWMRERMVDVLEDDDVPATWWPVVGALVATTVSVASRDDVLGEERQRRRARPTRT